MYICMCMHMYMYSRGGSEACVGAFAVNASPPYLFGLDRGAARCSVTLGGREGAGMRCCACCHADDSGIGQRYLPCASASPWWCETPRESMPRAKQKSGVTASWWPMWSVSWQVDTPKMSGAASRMSQRKQAPCIALIALAVVCWASEEMTAVMRREIAPRR